MMMMRWMSERIDMDLVLQFSSCCLTHVAFLHIFLNSCTCYFLLCVSENKLLIYRPLLFSIWPYIVYLPFLKN